MSVVVWLLAAWLLTGALTVAFALRALGVLKDQEEAMGEQIRRRRP